MAPVIVFTCELHACAFDYLSSLVTLSVTSRKRP